MQELPVINRTQELYEAVVKITPKLPALQHQTIGRRLEDNVLGLLELLVMAKHTPTAQKGMYLIKASAPAAIFVSKASFAMSLLNP